MGPIEQFPMSICRWYIYRNLFVAHYRDDDCIYRGKPLARAFLDEALRENLVMALFPKWEAEELICVHGFALSMYSEISSKVDWRARYPGFDYHDLAELGPLVFDSVASLDNRNQQAQF